MHKPCVYKTNALKGYLFQTHRNDLIIDRKDSEAVEVIFTVLQPGQKSPLHDHRDCEQLWYVLEGARAAVDRPGARRAPHRPRRRGVDPAIHPSCCRKHRGQRSAVPGGGRVRGEQAPRRADLGRRMWRPCAGNGWNFSVVDVQYGQ